MGARRYLASITLALIVGCNAPPVQRQDEIDRFRSEMQLRGQAIQVELSRPLSMEQCVRLALANSLELHIRNLALRLRDDQVRLAIAGGLPKLSLQYNQSYRSNKSLIEFRGLTTEMEDQNQRALGVSAMMPLLDFGLTYYAWRIALDQRQQDRLLIARSEQLLRRDIRVAYAQHAAALRQEKLARQSLAAGQKVLEIGKALEREKMAVRAETILVEAAVAQANLELSLAQQRVQETHLLLGQFMSLPPGAQFSIYEQQPVLPPPPTTQQVAAMEERALVARPELAVQDLARHISASAVRHEAANFFPQLNGTGSFNWTSASTVVNPSFFLLGFNITHSLLDGTATLWRYDIAKTNMTLEEQRTLLVSLGVMYEVELTALRVVQAREIVTASEILESARREALDRVIKLYQEGMEDAAGAARSIADLTSQATILDRARTNYQTAWYELEAAVLPEELPTTRATSRPAATAATKESMP